MRKIIAFTQFAFLVSCAVVVAYPTPLARHVCLLLLFLALLPEAVRMWPALRMTSAQIHQYNVAVARQDALPKRTLLQHATIWVALIMAFVLTIGQY
ncbi:MAG: hypothetical protein JSR59_11705 [Proteobacteria bacterium]|nr:hypothetical protein [Pseudomonadota bacterium]